MPLREGSTRLGVESRDILLRFAWLRFVNAAAVAIDCIVCGASLQPQVAGGEQGTGAEDDDEGCRDGAAGV